MLQSRLLPFLFVAVLLSGCAKNYLSPDARQLAARHRVIAVVPPIVILENWNKSQPNEQERREGLKVQQTLYSWLYARKSLNKLPINILTVRETNDVLENAGYFDRAELSPAAICQLLGVDGLIITDYGVKNKASGGEALASAMLLGVKPASAKTNMTLGLFDGSTEKVIWSYQDKLYDYDRSSSVNIGETIGQSLPHQDALNLIIKRASSRLPYARKAASFVLAH